MKEIIKAQGGNPDVNSKSLKPGKYTYTLTATNKCAIESFNIKSLTLIARILGAPDMKGSGIYLNRKIGEIINPGDPICTFHSENMYNLKEGKESLKNLPLMNFK